MEYYILVVVSVLYFVCALVIIYLCLQADSCGESGPVAQDLESIAFQRRDSVPLVLTLQRSCDEVSASSDGDTSSDDDEEVEEQAKVAGELADEVL